MTKEQTEAEIKADENKEVNDDIELNASAEDSQSLEGGEKQGEIPAENAQNAPESEKPKPYDRLGHVHAKLKEKRAQEREEVEAGERPGWINPDQSQAYFGDALNPNKEVPQEEVETGEEAESAAAEEENLDEQLAAAQAGDQERLVKLKVDGKEIELPESQVIAEAQKAIAQPNVMERLKQDQARTQAMFQILQQQMASANHTAPQAQEGQQQTEDSSADQTGNTEELLAIVERLQDGSPEEAAQALKQFKMDSLQEGARLMEQRLGDVDQRIQGHLEQQDASRQSVAELEKFAQDNQELASTRTGQAAVLVESSQIMREMLQSRNYGDDFVKQKAQEWNVDAGTALQHIYGEIAKQPTPEGYEAFPKGADLLNRAAGRVRKTFGIPETVDPSQQAPEQAQDYQKTVAERETRKRNANGNLRTAATRTPASQERPRSQDESRKLAATRMRGRTAGVVTAG